jgi:hypothetical protein
MKSCQENKCTMQNNNENHANTEKIFNQYIPATPPQLSVPIERCSTLIPKYNEFKFKTKRNSNSYIVIQGRKSNPR